MVGMELFKMPDCFSCSELILPDAVLFFPVREESFLSLSLGGYSL